MSSDFSDAGRRMRAIRRMYTGDNQTEFARRAGLGRQAWNHYEKGIRRIDIGVAIRIADEFRITLDWIYRGSLAGLDTVVGQQLVAAYRAEGPTV